MVNEAELLKVAERAAKEFIDDFDVAFEVNFNNFLQLNKLNAKDMPENLKTMAKLFFCSGAKWKTQQAMLAELESNPFTQ